jgi:hypothetical protein
VPAKEADRTNAARQKHSVSQIVHPDNPEQTATTTDPAGTYSYEDEGWMALWQALKAPYDE